MLGPLLPHLHPPHQPDPMIPMSLCHFLLWFKLTVLWLKRLVMTTNFQICLLALWIQTSPHVLQVNPHLLPLLKKWKIKKTFITRESPLKPA
jgi:hypothetical protein